MINMSQAKRWSCCKSVKPDAPGCKTDYHVEDTEFTKFLVDSYAQINSSSTPAVSASTAASLPSKLHFPPKKTISCEKRSPESNLPEKSTNGTGLGDVCVAEGGPPSPDSAADSTSDKPSCEPPSDLGAVVRHRHVVQTNDSIMKLCLLYNVSAELILSTNEIFHEKDIHTREFLIIPSSVVPKIGPPPEIDEEARQKKKIILFVRCTQCVDAMEAQGYLASHDWDVTSAVEAYRSDIQWEKMNLNPPKERECCFF